MGSGGLRTANASIRFGGERIPFKVDFGKRRRLYIMVNPDRSVQVKAPRWVSLETVLDFVRKRAGWISKHRNHFAECSALPLTPRYVSGELVLYLGRRYRLKVVRANPEAVRLRGQYLIVRTADRQDTGRIEALMREWYVDHAWSRFTARLEKCLQSFPWLGKDIPELKVRQLKNSWGTCSPNGSIHLSWELVKTPLACIDYVITHELCHLRHRNHSKAFYRLLSRCMVDWKQQKERLDRYVS